ncbi:MAG TPA: hypothetical protein VIV56_16845 [Gemmatimonadales bacterium]
MGDYTGSKDANADTVTAYLVRNYQVQETRARELVMAHHELVEKGERLASMAYYVGDQIANRENLKEREDMEQ